MQETGSHYHGNAESGMIRFLKPSTERMHRSRIALIVIALATIAGAYFAGRSQSLNTTAANTMRMLAPARAKAGDTEWSSIRTAAAGLVPPSGNPLRNVFRALQAKADTGDVAAATRLYRDLSLCRRYPSIESGITRHAEELIDEKTDAMSAQQLADYQAQLNAAESNQQQIARFHALCDGVDREMLDSLVPNLQHAARLGEPYARACYLDRGPNLDPEGLLAHPQLLVSYRSSAPGMIEAGIAAGDWRVVDLLRTAQAPATQTLLSALLGKDAERDYRHLKLFRLGSGTKQDPQLDRDLADASAELTSMQIADADAWAQTTFQQNFKGRSIDADGPLWDPCVFPYE